jgi:hypothetical protein
MTREKGSHKKHTSGSVKEPAYKTVIRTPYVKISKALHDPYRRVGLAEPLATVQGRIATVKKQ